MTDAEKKMKKFTASIRRKLNMPRDVKARVMNDFLSSITARREAGQTDEQIYAELGTPNSIARELNEQMKEFTYKKSPWRWACLGVAILCAVVLLFGGSIGIHTFLINKSISSSLGIIGGADGPTSIFIATPEGYDVQQFIIYGILLVMGVVGFIALGHIKRK